MTVQSGEIKDQDGRKKLVFFKLPQNNPLPNTVYKKKVADQE